MKTQSKAQEFQWLPTLIIDWNMIDLVLHVAIDMAEPLRIAGNVVAIAAALIVLLANVKSYAPYILGGAAIVVVVLNAIHSVAHGWIAASFIFIDRAAPQSK